MTETNFKLGVIEGADFVGKTTQVRLLEAALGLSVHFGKFPDKDGFFGKIVYESLAGKHGDFLGLSPYLAYLPYACDQADQRADLSCLLSSGHVILDRYVPSNLAHQAAKVPKRERAALIAHIEEGTYERLGVVRPDFVIVLDMPVEVSLDLAKKRGGDKDQHERNVDYQRAVRDVYRDLVAERENWFLVECAENKRPLSKVLIHERIRQIIQQMFVDEDHLHQF